jgi:hypothetical protein
MCTQPKKKNFFPPISQQPSQQNKMSLAGGRARRWPAPAADAPAVGNRVQVFHGKAKHTSGGLKQKDLFLNKKTGKITSKAQSEAAKKRMAQMKKKNPAMYRKWREQIEKNRNKVGRKSGKRKSAKNAKRKSAKNSKRKSAKNSKRKSAKHCY